MKAWFLLFLSLAVPCSAQMPSPPFVSDAQRRAQTGFPAIDESALAERCRVLAGRYDRAARTYRWSLESCEVTAGAWLAEFVDRGGRILATAALEGPTATQVSVVIPAELDLDQVDELRLRPAQ